MTSIHQKGLIATRDTTTTSLLFCFIVISLFFSFNKYLTSIEINITSLRISSYYALDCRNNCYFYCDKIFLFFKYLLQFKIFQYVKCYNKYVHAIIFITLTIIFELSSCIINVISSRCTSSTVRVISTSYGHWGLRSPVAIGAAKTTTPRDTSCFLNLIH